MKHISDDDLERYCMGMVVGESELAPIEEHILACPSCAERTAREQECVNAIRSAIEEQASHA